MMDPQGKRPSRPKHSATNRAKLKLVATADKTTEPARRAAQVRAVAVEPPLLRDSYSSTALAEIIDRSVHASTGRFTVGLSPMMLISAYMDWAAHLGYSPGKRLQLIEKAAKKSIRLGVYASRRLADGNELEPCIAPLPQDRRFLGEAWQSRHLTPSTRAFCSPSSGGTTP